MNLPPVSANQNDTLSNSHTFTFTFCPNLLELFHNTHVKSPTPLSSQGRKKDKDVGKNTCKAGNYMVTEKFGVQKSQRYRKGL
jgi:hypothetical protein